MINCTVAPKYSTQKHIISTSISWTKAIHVTLRGNKVQSSYRSGRNILTICDTALMTITKWPQSLNTRLPPAGAGWRCKHAGVERVIVWLREKGRKILSNYNSNHLALWRHGTVERPVQFNHNLDEWFLEKPPGYVYTSLFVCFRYVFLDSHLSSLSVSGKRKKTLPHKTLLVNKNVLFSVLKQFLNTHLFLY